MMNAAIFDPETSELLQLGASAYRDIAFAERALQRAQSRNCGHLSADDYLRLYELSRDLEALQDEARSAFARPLGFVSGKPFSIAELRAGAASGLYEPDGCCPFIGRTRVDFFYRDEKPIAITGHSPRTWQECRDFGVTHGLDAHPLPGSWISPGAYIAALYTLPRFVHLPKQRVAP